MTSPIPDASVRVRELATDFIAAIDAHLGAVESRSGETDPDFFAAFDQLRDAFLAYEDALYETYDEVTPFEVVDGEDDEDDEEDEDDGEDDGEDDELDELDELDDEDGEDGLEIEDTP